MQLLPIPFIGIAVLLLVRAEFRSKERQIYFLKPLSTILVILVAALSFLEPNVNTGYSTGILAGLLLSFGGDMSLIFSSTKAFMAGLILFLLAHVAYTVTFTLFNGFYPADLFSGIMLLAMGTLIYRYLEPNLGKMKIPVIIYIGIICLMVNRAVSTLFGTAFTPAQAWLITTGATLFWISDLILAVNRFRQPLKYHRISLAFYYSGQLCIALSTTLLK